MSEELKACPFCKNDVEIIKKVATVDGRSTGTSFDIQCKSFDCYLEHGANWWFPTEEELIESYNRRAND